MAIPRILVNLVCCSYIALASEHSHYLSHTIPIEGYEAKLEDLGEHVEYHKPPVKVIKITKTVAVKVPVPYPVKIVQKVPYPVHVNKPYPVPVPQIVHVPHPHYVHAKASEGTQHHDSGAGSFAQHYTPTQENSYHVQEPSADVHHQNEHAPSEGQGGNSYHPSGGQSGHSFEIPSSGGHSFLQSQEGQIQNGNEGDGHNFGGGGNEYSSEDFSSSENGHYGPSTNDESGNEESISYHRAINEYLKTHQQNNNGGYH